MSKEVKTQTKNPTVQPKDEFVIDFQAGSALVKVWLCPGRDGTKYLKGTVHHLYKAQQSGKWQTPRHFFASNEERLVDLIRKASEFMRDHNDDAESALATADRIKAEVNAELPVAGDLASNGVAEESVVG